MSIYGRGLRGKATRLHAELVRARGACERCGTTSRQLHCAHIFSRRYAATRCDPRNGICLCAGCHRWFDGDGPIDERLEWLLIHIGLDLYEDLKTLAYSSPKTNDTFWQERIDHLEALKDTDV